MRAQRWTLFGSAAALSVCWYMFGLVSDADWSGAWMAPRSSIGVLFTVLIVLWPLIGGVAAADAVLVTRGPRLGFIEALPPAARARLLGGRLALVWSGVLAGTVASCAVAAVVGFAHGGGWSWGALALVPFALAGALAFGGVGYALGLRLRSWFVPAGMVLGGYALGNIPSLALLEWYTGGYPPATIVAHPVWSVYGPLTLGHALIAVAGFAGVMSGWSRLRAVVSGVALVAAVATFVAVDASIRPTTQFWVADDHSTWQCSPLNGGSSLCIPRDVPQCRDAVASAVGPMASRAAVMMAASEPIRWVPGDPGAGEIGYRLPLGQALSPWEQATAAAEGPAAKCVESQLLAAGDAAQGTQTDAAVVAAWLAGDQADADDAARRGVSLPVSADEAVASWARLVSCDY